MDSVSMSRDRAAACGLVRLPGSETRTSSTLLARSVLMEACGCVTASRRPRIRVVRLLLLEAAASPATSSVRVTSAELRLVAEVTAAAVCCSRAVKTELLGAVTWMNPKRLDVPAPRASVIAARSVRLKLLGSADWQHHRRRNQ